jgi:Flp pilus assembly protein TadG
MKTPPRPAAPAPRRPAGHMLPSYLTRSKILRRAAKSVVFAENAARTRSTNLIRAWYLRRPTSPGSDQGSVAVFTVVFAVAVIFLLALIVDGGNAMNARERAADIAGQAARAAADDISPATLRSATLSGNALPIDWGSACGYAQQVVQKYGAGLAGTTVTMSACPGQKSSATQAAITVQITTRPLIGGGILGTFTETATGTATTECGNAVQQGGC